MSNNKTTTVRSGGNAFIGILTIAFIVLKLIGAIEWSWIWVLSPLWISWILIIAVVAIVLIFTLIGVV